MTKILHPELAPRYGYHPASTTAAPVVSVITPAYNAGILLLETAESLLRQSLQQWEWVIVNDGSTDAASLRALLPLRSADARIHVVDTPNQGLPAARNAGVAASRAPLLFFLDADDLLAPTALEKLVWSLVSRPHSAFAGAWTRIFGSQNLLTPRGFDTRHIFPHDNPLVSAAMVRRSAFDALGGFDETRRQGMEDYDFWVRAAAQGLWGHDVREYLLWIRRKTLQQYTSYRWSFQDQVDARRQFRRDIARRFPRLAHDGPPSLPDPASDPFPRIMADPPFENRLQPRGARRILMLLPALVSGGADRVALDLANGLTARGDRVTVALTREQEQGWLPDMEAITPDVFNLPAFLAPGDMPRFLRYLVESRSITHVLISNSVLGYELLPFLRAHCPRVVFLDYVHLEQEQRHGGFARMAADHDDLLDLHLVTSDYLRRFTIDLGADSERTEVCYIGADVTAWRADEGLRKRVRGELGIPADAPLILFVGRITAQKRPQLAAGILRDLRDRGVAFRAVIAGAGDEMLALRSRIRQYRLGATVQLLGGVPNSRVRELLAAADMLLLPSESEGIAVVLFEALASGVVPVSAAVGGQPELITPDVGVLIARGPNERGAYVDALERLISNPEQRRAMAAAGREIVSEWSVERFVEHMQAAFDHASALANTTPRPRIPAGAGLAAATLAMEHDQLERRLRRLAPVRLALQWRWTTPGRMLARLASNRRALDRVNRTLYAARRKLGDGVRALLRRT